MTICKTGTRVIAKALILLIQSHLNKLEKTNKLIPPTLMVVQLSPLAKEIVLLL